MFYLEGMKNEPKYLTSAEVAERLNVSIRHLGMWRLQGPGHGPRWEKWGHKTIRYNAADVATWESANREARA